MSASETELAARIEALHAAIATGALEVQQGAERVRYRSLAEMRQALALAEARLAGGTARRPTHFQPVFDRGS